MLAWHARGHQFDPGILHALKKTIERWSFCFYAMQKSTPGMVIITLTGFPRLSLTAFNFPTQRIHNKQIFSTDQSSGKIPTNEIQS